MNQDDPFAGYRLERLLGEGGMARVYRAYDPRTDRFVALKILKGSWRDDELLVERFLDEAKKNGPLSHPNIVRIHRVDAAPQPFIDMELVEGPTLGDHLRRHGRLPADEVARIGRELAAALEHAHRLGRVHRDVKPGNVMMADEGRTPKLVDFGIAMIDRPEAMRLTQHGEMIGTPRYMAPEQVRGERVDARTDLYALGAVLYELLAGRPAVEGDSLVAVTTRILGEAPAPLRRAAPETPPALVAVVERLMAKQSGARFANATEAMDALAGCFPRGTRDGSDGSAGAGRRSAPGARGRWSMSRWVMAAAALVALAVFGGVGYLLLVPPALPNQPPIAVADAAETTAAAAVTVPVLANDRDPEGLPLRLASASTTSGGGGARTEGGALVFDPAGAFGSLPRGQSASVVLSYTVADPAGAQATGQVTVTVRGAAPASAAPSVAENRPPLVQDLAHEMSAADRQAAIALDQLASDPDGDALTFEAAPAPRDGPGEVTVSGGLLLFAPGAGFTDLPRGERRTVAVPVTVRDGRGLESRAEVKITVAGVAEPALRPPAEPPAPQPPSVPTAENRAPEAGDLAQATLADQPLTVELRALARDPDGDPLRFSAPAAPVDGPGAVGVDGDLLRFEPGQGFADLPRDEQRTVTVPVTASDPQGLEARASLRVTVTGVREPPLPSFDLREALAKAEQVARAEPCARLETEAAGGDGLRVLLAGSDPALELRVARELQRGIPAAAEVRFAALPAGAVACRVFELLNRATVPVPPRFMRLQAPVDGACDAGGTVPCYSGVEQGVLAEGERLVLSVDPPPDMPYLAVDYFMADGSVAHLYPPHAGDGELVPAARYADPAPRGRIVIGDSRAGRDDPNEYPVGPPFGHELVVAAVAAEPLFGDGRPFVEPAVDYLAALERALGAQGGSRTPNAAAIWLQTRAAHP